MPESICDLGSSVRNGKTFSLTVGGETIDVDLETGLGITGIAPKCAKIHKAIYDSQDCSIIKHVTDPDVIAVSCTGEDMIPMIDDFAQIAGVDVKTVRGSTVIQTLVQKILLRPWTAAMQS